MTGCTMMASCHFIPPEACSAIPAVIRRAIRYRSELHHLGCLGFLSASEIASVELMVPVGRTISEPHLTVCPETDLRAKLECEGRP
jgi:hypothetical protein